MRSRRESRGSGLAGVEMRLLGRRQMGVAEQLVEPDALDSPSA